MTNGCTDFSWLEDRSAVDQLCSHDASLLHSEKVVHRLRSLPQMQIL